MEKSEKQENTELPSQYQISLSAREWQVMECGVAMLKALLYNDLPTYQRVFLCTIAIKKQGYLTFDDFVSFAEKIKLVAPHLHGE